MKTLCISLVLLFGIGSARVGPTYDGTRFFPSTGHEMLLCGVCQWQSNSYYKMECDSLSQAEGWKVGTLKYNCDSDCSTCTSSQDVTVGERVDAQWRSGIKTSGQSNASTDAWYATHVNCCPDLVRIKYWPLKTCVGTSTKITWLPQAGDFESGKETYDFSYCGYRKYDFEGSTTEYFSVNWAAGCGDFPGEKTTATALASAKAGDKIPAAHCRSITSATRVVGEVGDDPRDTCSSYTQNFDKTEGDFREVRCASSPNLQCISLMTQDNMPAHDLDYSGTPSWNAVTCTGGTGAVGDGTPLITISGAVHPSSSSYFTSLVVGALLVVGLLTLSTA